MSSSLPLHAELAHLPLLMAHHLQAALVQYEYEYTMQYRKRKYVVYTIKYTSKYDAAQRHKILNMGCAVHPAVVRWCTSAASSRRCVQDSRTPSLVNPNPNKQNTQLLN